jgi:hypothetical protein
MERLKCKRCYKEKDLDEFRYKINKNGTKRYEKQCKPCNYLHGKKRVQMLKTENPKEYEIIISKRKQRDNNYYSKNKKQINSRNNNYYDQNKSKIQAQRKQYRIKYPERVKNWKNSYRDSLAGKVGMNLRKRLRTEIGSGKDWLELLDCSFDNFKKWFEYNFKLDNNIFTWENYGKVWTIDHVIPCKSFDLTKKNNQYHCFNWRNTLPVTKTYNQEKNGKIVYSDIMKLNKRLIEFEKQLSQLTDLEYKKLIEIN